MPWYTFPTPTGFKQVYAASRDVAAAQTGANPGQMAEHNDPVSGVTFWSAGGSGGASGGGYGPFSQTIGGFGEDPTPQGFESEYRAAANRANLGGGGNPFRGYLNRQAAPASDVYDVGRAVGLNNETSPYAFISSLFGKGLDFGQGDNFGQGLTAAASAAWNEMLRQRASGSGPETNEFLDPEASLDPSKAIQLGEVANRAARTKYGYSSNLLPSAGEQYQRYLAQPRPAGGPPSNIIDFFNRRIFGR